MNNEKPMVSIIMPVYNSEQYLSVAIDSILNQTYSNFELLLIDDGSIDQSGSICDLYEKKDSRVRVFHQKNGGICNARNKGLSEAVGKYISFCDNDDEFSETLLEDNIKKAEDTGADVIRFLREHLIIVDDKIVKREIISTKYEMLLNEDTFCKYYFEIIKLMGGVWTGLYRRDFLEKNNIQFNTDIKFGYEDMHFNLQVLRFTSNIYINPHVYYHWIERKVYSTSQKYSANRFDALRECAFLETELNKQYRIDEQFPTQWSEHLIDMYLIKFLKAITNSNCNLKYKEKIDLLLKFRENPIFNLHNIANRIQLNNMKFKARILYYLFQNKHLNLLLILYSVSLKLSPNIN